MRAHEGRRRRRAGQGAGLAIPRPLCRRSQTPNRWARRPQNNGSGAGASTAGQEQQTRRGAGACERARVAVTARGTPVAGRARDACQTELAEARARTACVGREGRGASCARDCQSRNLTHWRRAYAWRRSSERDPAEWLLAISRWAVGGFCRALRGGREPHGPAQVTCLCELCTACSLQTACVTCCVSTRCEARHSTARSDC